MAFFKKQPVVIEAAQMPDAINWHNYRMRCAAPFSTDFINLIVQIPTGSYREALEGIYIKTLEGEVLASPGDWIIKGVAGEFYPCKPEIFEQTYEEVSL